MIISKEESQGQVQVYIEEIIQENPTPSLESGLRESCNDLTGEYCTDKKYCDLQCGSCKLSCSLFKRGRCEDVNYCRWTVGNICKCSGEEAVTPTICTDSDEDGWGLEGTDLSGCFASTTSADCDDNNLLIGGGGRCEDVSCTSTSECASGLSCRGLIPPKHCKPD